MSTDMAKHFEHCQAFNQHPPTYDKESEADRMLLIKVLLHAADIGNAVRPFHVNQIMSRRVHKEFEAQARDEAAAGLPITFAVDSNNPRMCAQVELNFLDYVVSPLWTRLAEVMPVFTEQLNQLKSNRRHYEELANLEP
uniref:PDEase domain-containing protein n=2 Tax=Dunaliella tertiolecta TaxID=3047 RepID=A0A7S3R908_DUNTE